MTNGEKIKAILKPKEYQIRICGGWVDIEIQCLGINFSCGLEWWNAEYKEPTTKNDLAVDVPDNNVGKIDYISRADARSLICKIDQKHHMSGMSWKAFKDLYNGIDDIPSVTPQEPKTGHWIEDAEQHHVEKTYHCSECGHGVWGEYEKTEYCGGCGAKMVEPQESEEQEDGNNYI